MVVVGLSLTAPPFVMQVFIKHEGEKLSLIVDGINAQSKRFPAAERTRLHGPLYVGGAPPALLVRCPLKIRR